MKKDHFCLYPIYINLDRSLSEGRKYRKELCISNPQYKEIENVLKFLGIEHVGEPLKRHPKSFFTYGRFQISKVYGKAFVIEGLIQNIIKLRSQSAYCPPKKTHGPVHGVTQNGVYVENKLNLVPKKKKSKKGNK